MGHSVGAVAAGHFNAFCRHRQPRHHGPAPGLDRASSAVLATPADAKASWRNAVRTPPLLGLPLDTDWQARAAIAQLAQEEASNDNTAPVDGQCENNKKHSGAVRLWEAAARADAVRRQASLGRVHIRLRDHNSAVERQAAVMRASYHGPLALNRELNG
jgi:hypothetical protein